MKFPKVSFVDAQTGRMKPLPEMPTEDYEKHVINVRLLVKVYTPRTQTYQFYQVVLFFTLLQYLD